MIVPKKREKQEQLGTLRTLNHPVFETIIVYLFSMAVNSMIERLIQKYYNKQLTNEKGLFFVCFFAS